MARVAIVLGILIVLVSSSSALAQSVADELLPPADAFGDGWTLLATPPVSGNLAPAFEEGAHGVYGGPHGARVVVSVYRVAEGMAAVRNSWELGNEWFEDYRFLLTYTIDYGRERELADVSLPTGCADARRVDGTDNIGFQSFPIGITLCAADPDRLVLVFASGEVNGLTGYRAADFAVEATLGANGGTPTP